MTAAVMTGADLKALALSWMRDGEYAKAGEAFSALCRVDPDVAGLWFYAGQCAELMGDYKLAAEAFQGAIDAHKRKPGQRDRARAHFSLGSNLFRLGLNTDALHQWKIGLRGKCDSPEARFVRSQVRLAVSDYCHAAWFDYEARRSLPGWADGINARADTGNLREWDGRSAGRVLVVGAQGAGDCIQFSRYLPVVHLASESRPIVAAGTEVNAVLPYDRTGDADWWAPMDSLPFLLKMYEPIAPQNVGTLPHLAYNLRPRVGVCWKGSPHHQNDLDRSCHDLDMMTALQDERWELVSLQHGYDFHAKDYAETAELMRTLDAVFTVDSAPLHLAGTLGIPTVLVPPASPEWRWGIKGTTTVWYPSVRIARRKNVWAWGAAIAEAKLKLAEIVNAV